MTIKQGDQYRLKINVVDDGTNSPLSSDSLAGFEVMFGQTRHYIEATDTTGYDPVSGDVAFPLTQEETFALKAGGVVMVDLRVCFKSGDVVGIENKIPVTIKDATSEVVL